jgi:hypothetical protein
MLDYFRSWSKIDEFAFIVEDEGEITVIMHKIFGYHRKIFFISIPAPYSDYFLLIDLAITFQCQFVDKFIN